MIPFALNRYSAETARFDELAKTVAQRYGASSQALAFILYEEFIFLRHTQAMDSGAVAVSARIPAVRSRISELYAGSFRAVPDHPTRRLGENPSVMEFPRDIFEEKYRPAVSTVEEQTTIVSSPEFGRIEPCRPYMYALDDLGNLKVWVRPFRFSDLVFGRNRATVDGIPVAHPMLVPEGLRVVAAGEVVFVGGDEIRGVIFNTKSGHFRPPPSCASFLKERTSVILGLPESTIDVFTISGPEDRKG